MITKLIFGSCLLADDYMRKHKLNKGCKYKYVNDYKDICGYKDCEIIMLFESWRKPDSDTIETYCKANNIKMVRNSWGGEEYAYSNANEIF